MRAVGAFTLALAGVARDNRSAGRAAQKDEADDGGASASLAGFRAARTR